MQQISVLNGQLATPTSASGPLAGGSDMLQNGLVFNGDLYAHAVVEQASRELEMEFEDVLSYGLAVVGGHKDQDVLADAACS